MSEKTISALLVGTTRWHANLPLSSGCELHRPIGYFERLVLSDCLMHAIKKFSKYAIFPSVQTQRLIGALASHVDEPKAFVVILLFACTEGT